MKNSELLQACLIKAAVEAKEDLAQSMRSRVGNWHSQDSSVPAGLPDWGVNVDETNHEYPMKNQVEAGNGWKTITGTGHGASLGEYKTG